MNDEFDCLRCGACCVSDIDAPDYVHLNSFEVDLIRAEDKDRLIYEDTTHGKTLHSMRTSRDSKGNCRCIALKGVVGDEVSCSIYEVRPNVCRNFEPGTEVCEYARQIFFGVLDR